MLSSGRAGSSSNYRFERAEVLDFVRREGIGGLVTCAGDDVEFVCIPRPLERSEGPDGGPVLYRVAHRVKLWAPGKAPRLERTAVEGTLPLVL
jgi:alkaline phosphatase D